MGFFDLWGRIDDKGKIHAQCNELLHCFQYFMTNRVSALKLRNYLQNNCNLLWWLPKQRKKKKENYLFHFLKLIKAVWDHKHRSTISKNLPHNPRKSKALNEYDFTVKSLDFEAQPHPSIFCFWLFCNLHCFSYTIVIGSITI